LRSEEFSPHAEANEEAYKLRVARYESLAALPLAGIIPIAYWGRRGTVQTALEAFDVIGNATHDAGPNGGLNWWLDLQRYPAALMLYAAGVAALANHQYPTLASVLQDAEVYPFAAERQRLSSYVWRWQSATSTHWNSIYETKFYTPISERLSGTLRPLLAPYLERNKTYEDTFDKFEYLAGLVEFRRTRENDQGWGPSGPIGRFVWRGNRDQDKVWMRLDNEISKLGDRWGGFTSGLFKSPVELNELAVGYRAFIGKVSQQRGWF
jgi:hypothetical protein